MSNYIPSDYDVWECENIFFLKSHPSRINKFLGQRYKEDNIKTDRKISKYKNEVLKILQVEMNDIKNVIGKFSVTDMWSVQYHKNDFHQPHTHGSLGYSAILYLDTDIGTSFIQPWNDPITNKTVIVTPTIKEGDIIIFPAHILHFTNPIKKSIKRTIISWDIKI